MMPAMNAHPTGRRVLDTAQTENGERVLQPFGADEASVGEQAMEAQADAERAKDIKPEKCHHQAGPTKEPGHKCKQGRQVDRCNRRRIDLDQPERLRELRNERLPPGSAAADIGSHRSERHRMTTST